MKDLETAVKSNIQTLLDYYEQHNPEPKKVGGLKRLAVQIKVRCVDTARRFKLRRILPQAKTKRNI